MRNVVCGLDLVNAAGGMQRSILLSVANGGSMIRPVAMTGFTTAGSSA
jgi:hypothetical protein